MGFLRRLLGGGEPDDKAPDDAPAGSPGSAAAVSPEVDEAARELDLLRADQARLNDELLQRQLRYAGPVVDAARAGRDAPLRRRGRARGLMPSIPRSGRPDRALRWTAQTATTRAMEEGR